MCYIVECIWEAFFHTMYQSKFLCGFYFHAVMTNWQTTLVYWFVFLFNVLCKNYLKQKLSTWKTPLKTNIEDDVRTHYCNDCLDLLIIKCETVWQIQTGPAQRHEWNTPLLQAHVPQGTLQIKWKCSIFGGFGGAPNSFLDHKKCQTTTVVTNNVDGY